MKVLVRLGAAVLILCLFAMLPGYSVQEFSDSRAAGADDEILTVTLITMDSMDEHWLKVKEGAQDAAKELGGITIDFAAPQTKVDASAQAHLVETAIKNRSDAILLAALEKQSLKRAVEKAKEAGIPVVFIDSGANTDEYDAFFSTNNASAAELAADTLAQRIGGKGQIAIVNAQAGAGTTMTRETAFKNRIEGKYPDIEIVGVQYSDGDKHKAFNFASDFLFRYPDLAGFYACNEGATVGCGNAVDQLGKNGTVQIVGFDSSDEVEQLILANAVQAVIVQNAYTMGYRGVKAAVSVIQGKTIEPRNIDTGVTVVTRDDLLSNAIVSSALVSESVNSSHTGEVVPLMLCVEGNQPEDFGLVQDQVNKILEKKIGARIDVCFIDPSKYDVLYPKLFTGEQPFHLISVNGGYNYHESAVKEAYMPLTEEMLERYAPRYARQLEKRAFSSSWFDEKLYLLPAVSRAYEQDYVALIRGDLMEQYGFTSIGSAEELERFLRMTKMLSDVIPYDTGRDSYELMQAVYLQPRGICLRDDSLLAAQEADGVLQKSWLPNRADFLDYINMVKRWRSEGFFSDTAAGSLKTGAQSFLQGETAVYICPYQEVVSLAGFIQSRSPALSPRIFDISGERDAWQFQQGVVGFALMNGSAHATTSLALIEQLYTNETVARLLRYGIEDLHYTIVDGKYQPTEQFWRYPAENNPVWRYNEAFTLYPAEPLADARRIEQRYQGKLTNSETVIQRFEPDFELEKIDLYAKEKANIRLIYPLTLGGFQDVSGAINEAQSALAQCGFFEFLWSELEKSGDQAAEEE